MLSEQFSLTNFVLGIITHAHVHNVESLSILIIGIPSLVIYYTCICCFFVAWSVLSYLSIGKHSIFSQCHKCKIIKPIICVYRQTLSCIRCTVNYLSISHMRLSCKNLLKLYFAGYGKWHLHISHKKLFTRNSWFIHPTCGTLNSFECIWTKFHQKAVVFCTINVCEGT